VLYSARVPRGWTAEENDLHKGDFLESKWHDPSEPTTSVLVDAIDGETMSPADKAGSVRAATSQTSGYRELSFGPDSGRRR